MFSKTLKYAIKNKKAMTTINEELELSESDKEFDKFDEYQHIYDGLQKEISVF